MITTLISDVATAYFNLLELDMELAIAKNTLATREESLRLIKLQQQGGVATLLDVRQGEQLVYSAAESIPDSERQIEQTENQISLLLGQKSRSRTTKPALDRAANAARSAGRLALVALGETSRTSRQRSKFWSRPTPTSASPRRPIFHRSRSPESSVIKARRYRIYSRVQGGCGALCLRSPTRSLMPAGPGPEWNWLRQSSAARWHNTKRPFKRHSATSPMRSSSTRKFREIRAATGVAGHRAARSKTLGVSYIPGRRRYAAQCSGC